MLSLQIVALAHYHKLTYMGERLCYYGRRLLAQQQPHLYFSSIGDGMNQGHSILPWMRNQATLSDSLTQHLQGMLIHGRKMVIYRTFSNVPHSANLSIHCWLLELERECRMMSCLPNTIYHQIDGGSQETNGDILGKTTSYAKQMCVAIADFFNSTSLVFLTAIACLLIQRGLTKEIIILRLLVGHTHDGARKTRLFPCIVCIASDVL